MRSQLMKPPPGSSPSWRISTYCTGGTCVQLALLSSREVAIGDSKNPEGVALRYSREEFAAFVKGVKAGEFDDFC